MHPRHCERLRQPCASSTRTSHFGLKMRIQGGSPKLEFWHKLPPFAVTDGLEVEPPQPFADLDAFRGSLAAPFRTWPRATMSFNGVDENVFAFLFFRSRKFFFTF